VLQSVNHQLDYPGRKPAHTAFSVLRVIWYYKLFAGEVECKMQEVVYVLYVLCLGVLCLCVLCV
jgi:hypothetical protein